MKRPNGAGTVRKLGGKRRKPWAAVITTGWDPETGKRQQKYVGYYETYQEAELALAVYRSEPLSKDDLTLEMVYAEWKAIKFRSLSKATQDSYAAAWKYLSQLQHLKIKDIRTGQLQRVIDTATCRPQSKVGEKPKPARPCSRSTLEKIKALAVMLWDYAMQNDVLEKNYAKFLTLPKSAAKTEKEHFTTLEVSKIKAAADSGSAPWADCIYMMIKSGFRISEFLSLDRFTVDLERGTFRAGLKTEAGFDRIVPIHPTCLPFVRSRLAQGGERMVCKSNGSAISADYFRKRCYYPTLEQIGVRSLNPHCTRHTFATQLAEAGASTAVIQRLMGHKKYSFTAETYTHIDVSPLKAALEAI